ncbi:MAG: signal peptidase I [Candidatus Omnitrophica bacterium]|nr:signal peptidase I [Candidatus Omnitrophota bacterium]MBI5144247.1 signal peptidase I [Candidatus Omnitrophota bacterium]
MNKQVKSQVREWVESIVIAIVLALFIRAFIIQAFKIPSGSMIPTFEIGDRIFVNKFLYGAKIPFTDFRLPAIREPKIGDIIVFVSPEPPKKDFVKRLIAAGGQTVEIKDGNILVDGKIAESGPPIPSIYYYNRGDYGGEGQKITTPKDSYYVLGDNSGSSRDSRYWGFVPKKNLIGKAVLIYWPLHRMKIIR